MPSTHVVERAYQLASAGAYSRRSEIDRALEKEGYTIADLQHLQGAFITKDLNRRCRTASGGLIGRRVPADQPRAWIGT